MDDHHQTVIKIMGIGGGGTNAVNRMIELGLEGVDFIAANTDAQALALSQAPTRVRLGPKVTRGLGAGGTPEWAKRPPRKAAPRSKTPSRAPTWSSSPPAWAAAPAPARSPSSPSSPADRAHRGRGHHPLLL